MAQEIMVAGAIYEDVPSVRLPDSNGVFHPFTDTSDTTAVAADVAEGKTFHLADGALATGTASGGGGGGTSADPKDVNFIDYDGRIVYSYTKDEFMALTAMPANPTHAGLVSQGWNWSLADAQEYVGKYGIQTIGQMYATESGATEIDIVLREGRLSPYLNLAPDGTVTIDWGDGSATDTLTGTSLTTREGIQHSYAAAGDYTISVHVVSGSVALYGTSDYTLLYKDSTDNNNRVYSNCVQAVRIGANTSIGDYAFYNCYSLSSVTIPSGVTSIGESAFRNCYSLSSVTIPNSVTSIGVFAFNYCYSLSSVTIPNSVTSIGSNAFNYCYSLSSVTIPSGVISISGYLFNYCYSLSSVTIPSGVTSIGDYALSNCNSLSSVTIPSGVTSIGESAFVNCYSLSSVTIPSGVISISGYLFNYCYSLSSVTIPSGVTSIGSNAFANCFGLGEIHFLSTTPPAVSSSRAFRYLPTDCKIYVPQGSLAAYTSAANYPSASTYTYVEE